MSYSNIRTNINDVLLGRGGNNHAHNGNEQLRRIALDRVGVYMLARKKEKAVISRQILHQIQTMDPPGRFLLYNYSTYEWEIVKDVVAREKVCQALRDAAAIEKEKEGASSDLPPAAQEEEPLPNILDVLSSEQLDISWNSIANSVVTPGSRNLIFITPGRHESGDDCEDKVHHNQGNVCDVGSIMPAKRKAGDDYENKVQDHRGRISDKRSTTHAKRKAVDNVKDEVLHFRVNLFDDVSMSQTEREVGDEHRGEVLPYRVNVSDDFDLFDGELLRATDDQVLNSAMTKLHHFIHMG